MFCRNCGTKINDTSNFCYKCGFNIKNKVLQQREIIDDNRIIYQIKPKFNMLYKLLSNLCEITIFMFTILFPLTYWLSFFYPSLATVFIISFTVAKTIFESRKYKELEYNFYATKIEYKEGFFTKKEKEMKYKYIREITVKKNFLENIFGLGTIKLFTSASSGGTDYLSGYGSIAKKNGIHIHCVYNVQEQYRIIKQIIDEGTIIE